MSPWLHLHKNKPVSVDASESVSKIAKAPIREMPRIQVRTTAQEKKLFLEFLQFLSQYIYRRGYIFFSYAEIVKDAVVGILYKRRGKFARPFLHTALMSVLFIGITFGPLLVSEATAQDQTNSPITTTVLRTSTGDTPFQTQQSQGVLQLRGGEFIDYVVQPDETISSIAQKYSLQPQTLYWENNLTAKTTIKPGDHIRIPPADGVRVKVQKGDTVYTLAKKYGLGDDDASAQPIIDYPFNTFADDETFALATGQYIFVPGGIVPNDTSGAPRPANLQVTTPNAGTVTPTGQFVWPAQGLITQGYFWYHPGIDIANRAGGKILAADAGTVVLDGWDTTGYGNRVVIDHGNGYATLYAHMSVIRVKQGQTLNKGDVVGDMGTTGHSTGMHLHFEIRKAGAQLNPLQFLR